MRLKFRFSSELLTQKCFLTVYIERMPSYEPNHTDDYSDMSDFAIETGGIGAWLLFMFFKFNK